MDPLTVSMKSINVYIKKPRSEINRGRAEVQSTWLQMAWDSLVLEQRHVCQQPVSDTERQQCTHSRSAVVEEISCKVKLCY